MHILLALLATVVTILILLNRLADAGISLAGLNPFWWNRRRKWRNQFEGDPIYRIDQPMELTALLMLALAKADGELSAEDKSFILAQFEGEFNLQKEQAVELLAASSHLLHDGSALRDNLNKVMKPSIESFTPVQIESALQLLQQLAQAVDGATLRTELFEKIQHHFSALQKPNKKW